MSRSGRQSPHLKLVTTDAPQADEELDTNSLDVSDVITDVEQLRQPASDAARAVMQEARLTTGTIKTLSKGRSDVFRMNPYDLHIKPGWNIAREMDDPDIHAHIDWLARDIANVGVKQPYRIHHEDGNFYITDGHLRHHAVFRAMNKYGASIMSVPVILGPQNETERDRTCMMLRANSGLALKPWGKGALMKRLVDWGWSEKQIADEFHCTRGRVRQLLELQGLPESMAAFIRKGISADHVMATYKAMGEAKAAVELGSEVVYAKAIGAKRVMPKHGREARLGSSGDGEGRARVVRTSKLTTLLAIIRRFAVQEEGEQWIARMSVQDGLTLARLAGMDVPVEAPSGAEPEHMMDEPPIEENDDSNTEGHRISAMVD